MRNRSLALSALVLFSLFVMVSSAYAGTPPPNAPAVIRSVTFEGINASDTLAVYTDYNPYDAILPATWGPVTARHLGGTHGFWCAGTLPAAASYPAGTRGQAALWLPECYQSTIKYSYIEPSLGALDGMPFVVSWSSNGPTDSVAPTGYSEAYPLAAAWTTITHERGHGGPPLSAGWLRFQFVSNPTQPSTGIGVTIDDIQVTGYTFGPVSGLTATREPGALATVTVNWTKPKAHGTDTPDPRNTYYRVWRLDVAAGLWTELTSTGAISDTSYVDPGSADVNKRYQYAVQAYDSPSSTSTWGMLAAPCAVEMAVPHFLVISGSPLAVAYGGATTFSAPLVDEVGSTLTSQTANVVVERVIPGQQWTQLASVAVTESVPGRYLSRVLSNVNASYRLRYKATGAVSGSVAVKATGYLGTPTTPPKVTRNKAFTVKGSANRVPLATRYVVLKAYHKETRLVAGKKKTVWIYRASAKGKVTAGNGVGTYAASFKVKQGGSWRITASLADAYNPAKTSGLRYFTAK